ncbi:MAG TPA: nuclease-related domain-containing protein [Candidatus Wunengus sp. YC60]|uniref:nuclease-related domain-containing protein n=1 Tax=Candidatus Wunengus sp. YC60 TaxID=3367697 RepID=UPI0040263277
MDGEALVAEELKKLPDEYVVIQDVKIPNTKTNIDFVVLGTNGIFAIEVKSHEGNITYNGQELLRNGYSLKKNFLWQVRFEATSLTEYLHANVDRNLYANALLVFSSFKAKLRFGESPVTGVVIIGRAWLIKHITSHVAQQTLKSEYIEQIVSLFHSG